MTVCMSVIQVAHAGADAPITPAFWAFQYSASTVGAPHQYCEDSCGPGPASGTIHNPTTGETHYYYGVIPVGVEVSDTSNRDASVEAQYAVRIFSSHAAAIAANSADRTMTRAGICCVPVAPIPLAHPLGATEWAHGVVRANACYLRAGIVYRNLELRSVIFSRGASVQGKPWCASELVWALRLEQLMLASARTYARHVVTIPSPSTTCARCAPLRTAITVRQPAICRGYKTYGVPTVPPLDTSKTHKAIVATNKGTFTITLLPKDAPTTVQSFVFLARHHYFDGVTFHRVVPGFVIQGGDPTGTGECGPGYTFDDENTNAGYPRGTVAMANSGPNTNGSQFFVVLTDNPGLQPNYSVFGHVSSGMDTVDRIAAVPLGPTSYGEISKPRTPVVMHSVSIVTE